ncbi:MAG: phosphatase PAP2 family protein [Deltaproteobacteria bacterium]
MGMTCFPQPLGVDIWAKNELAKLASPFLDGFFNTITELGSPTGLVIFTAAITLCLLYMRKRREGFFLGATMLVGWGLMREIKDLVARSRPTGEHLTYAAGFSFPSGHSMLSLVFYGFIVYLLIASGRVKNKTALIVAAGMLILLIGVSRVYLNVHYASDVAGGFLIGAFLLIAAIRLMNWSRGRWFHSWE